MTRTRYFLARFLQAFGWVRRPKRLTAAAYEMHLMQDGEEILGAYCWKNTEEIEDLSHEYWKLRQLDRSKAEIVRKVREAEKLLLAAQEVKVALLKASRDDENPLGEERDQITESIKSLEAERDLMMAQALSTKKKHGALKMKLQVLKEEGNKDDEIQECLKSLTKLRGVFIQEKEDLDVLKNKISSEKDLLDQVQGELLQDLKGSEGEKNEAYIKISRANQDITNYYAELSSIEEEQSLLFRDIGHFLNIHSNRRDCLQACKSQRVVLNQIQLLLKSIRRNRRLAEKSVK